MNKKLLVITFIVVLSFVMAQAQTRVTLGLSGFMAGYSFTNEDGDDVITTDSGLLFGPYFSLSSDRLSFGGSMFFGSFPNTEIDVEDVEVRGVDASIARKDLNLSLSYALIRNQGLTISPFIGLKYFNWNFSFDESGLEYSWDRGGTMVGGGLQGVIKPSPTSGFYLYASGAVLGGSITDEFEINDQGYSEINESSSATALISLNAGLGYRVPNSGLGINIGFRGDFFGSTSMEEDSFDDEAVSYTERVTGIVATISWTF